LSPEDRRLPLALLVSLLIHTLLMSLTFGGWELWFPRFAFPLQDRQIEAPELRVALVPAQVIAVEPAVAPVAEPMQQAQVEQAVASKPARIPSVSRARTTVRLAATPLRANRPADTAPPPTPAPTVIAVERIDQPTWIVPATPAMQTAPVITAAPSVSIPETAKPSLPKSGDAAPARPIELATLDPSKQEAQQQAEQQEVARQEAARQEAARQETARQEAARVKAAEVEAAQVKAAEVEAARVKAAEVEAARVKAAEVEAARVKAAEVEAARVKAAEVEAARVEKQEAEARREARLRAIGRQLDEEAAQREAATASARQAPSGSPLRRYRLFGRTDPNQEIILYAEAWERKIQMNMTLDMVREVAKQPHTDPLVTVAIRSDGSVEKLTFVQSSGAAAIDDAIRRIVDSQKPYRVFPPNLAREYDVIEIRRTWHFDTAVRLY
jgi:hypothetical protein